MINLLVDIVLWQTIGSHRSFFWARASIAAAAVRSREKKWRKLSKTLLSGSVWVRGKGFALQKDADPIFFIIVPVLGALFIQCPFSVFKETDNLWRLLKVPTGEQEGTTRWMCHFQTNQFTFLLVCWCFGQSR